MRNNDQITLKLAAELRSTLEAEAAAHGRSLSNLIRTILLSHATKHVIERAGADMGATR
jgi:uncharacterized protein (DUF1778 family)